MKIELDRLKKAICNTLCTSVKLHSMSDDFLYVEMPYTFPDGDSYSIYIKELAPGIVRLTDAAHTLMHLSYDNDIDKFTQGTRGILLNQIKEETSLCEEGGEFFINSSIEELGHNLLLFSHGISRIHDLTFLNKNRVESTFYDDLFESLLSIIGNSEKIEKDYIYPNIKDADNYPIDYYIRGKNEPLFIFGVPNRDKARLTTIIISHFIREHVDFNSLIVFQNQESIPAKDLTRLTNVAGETISSLEAQDDLRRKILKRAA